MLREQFALVEKAMVCHYHSKAFSDLVVTGHSSPVRSEDGVDLSPPAVVDMNSFLDLSPCPSRYMDPWRGDSVCGS